MDLKEAIEALQRAADTSVVAAKAAAVAADSATRAADRTSVTVDGLRAEIGAIRENALTSHEESRRNHSTLALAVNTQGKAVAALQRAVHGSDPPPPDSFQLHGLPPLDELAAHAARTASDANLEIAALEGRMTRGFARLEQQTTKIAAQNQEQSNWQGVGMRGLRRLLSPAGRIEVLKLAAILGTIFGIDHARPNPAPLPAQVIWQAPPPAAAPPLPVLPWAATPDASAPEASAALPLAPDLR